MPKQITIPLSDAQYEALESVFTSSPVFPGQAAPTTVEEWLAKQIARTILRPALEQFPTKAMQAKRRARDLAQKDLDDAVEPTIAVSIT